MPAIVFPNSDLLRLALANRLVPDEVALRPAKAVQESHGEWAIDAGMGLSHDASKGLNRIGVRMRAGQLPGNAQLYPCWAAILELQASGDPPSGPSLLKVNIERLTETIDSIQRLAPQPLQFQIVDTQALILVRDLPGHLTQTHDTYRSIGPSVWIRNGWSHPLGNLNLPGSLTLIDPDTWHLFPNESFHSYPSLYPFEGFNAKRIRNVDQTITIPQQLRLIPGCAGKESLFVATISTERLQEWISEQDERQIRHLQFASIDSPSSGERILLRMSRRHNIPMILPQEFQAYSQYSQTLPLFLPHGMRLDPVIRSTELTHILTLAIGTITWLEAHEQSYRIHRIPDNAFQPLTSIVRYRTPTTLTLAPLDWETQRYALPGFVVKSDTPPLPPPIAIIPPKELSKSAESKKGTWFGRLFGRFIGSRDEKDRDTKAYDEPEIHGESEDTRPIEPMVLMPQFSDRRGDWATHRTDLERRILEHDEPIRRELWPQLALVYANTANPADAALGWIKAIWSRPDAPQDWYEQWVQAEAKCARIPKEKLGLSELLAMPPGSQVDRVLAARLVQELSNEQYDGTNRRLPDIVHRLKQSESDMPIQLVWIAQRLAMKRDPLTLARCRDRLFARMASDGPSLDLDAPSFLRFHGNVSNDRFQLARDWIVRTRPTIHAWMNKHAASGRLYFAGLDANIPCTKAYADLMLAWGLSRLGDRVHVNEWVSKAESTLERSTGPNIDTRVHTHLMSLLRLRRRSASIGNHPSTDTPISNTVESTLSRYAIDKLVEHSRILGSDSVVDSYRLRMFQAIRGDSDLGHRLLKMLETGKAESGELSELLASAERANSTDNVLRITLIGLETVSDPSNAAFLLHGLGPLLQLLPDALRRWLPADGTPATQVQEFTRKMACRAMARACRLAYLGNHGTELREFATYLINEWKDQTLPLRDFIRKSGVELFVALQKLDQLTVARQLIQRLSDRLNSLEDQLSLSVGWFVTDREDLGIRILNEARNRLFVHGVSRERERTDLALAYAEAVRYTQSRIALGRLDELFQRLDTVTVKGAQAAYYALKPLEFVDIAVTTAVTDEFQIDDVVRQWLIDDELLIRRRVTRDLELALQSVD